MSHAAWHWMFLKVGRRKVRSSKIPSSLNSVNEYSEQIMFNDEVDDNIFVAETE